MSEAKRNVNQGLIEVGPDLPSTQTSSDAFLPLRRTGGGKVEGPAKVLAAVTIFLSGIGAPVSMGMDARAGQVFPTGHEQNHQVDLNCDIAVVSTSTHQ